MLHARLESRIPALAGDFASARPFRHVVIEDFLETQAAQALLDAFPRFEERHARNEMGEVGGKAVRMDLPSIAPAYADFDRLLQSPDFLALVEAITGIPELLYDPDYVGGGTHENLDGQSLDVHVDFNYLPKTGWHRRLNLILYLNHEWQEDWGGCLDLHADPWNPERDQIQRLLPLFNRCVIFETNEVSWHGFRPIQLPAARKDLSRKSLAVYLYTRQRPEEETAAPHATIYVPAGMPGELKPGEPLSEADWLELRRRFAQMKGQLKFLYQREQQFARERQELEQALRVAQESHAGFVAGSALADGPTVGRWPDGWCTTELRFGLRATCPVRRLRLRLWVPPQLREGQQLTLQIDGRSYSLALRRGHSNPIHHPLRLATGQACEFRLQAANSWRPSESGLDDRRELAYRLLEARLD